MLDFNFVDIMNSDNDCLDFSGGKYKISLVNLESCRDKAISIGENSIVDVKEGIIKNSKIGIATKDSSSAFVNELDIENVDLCLRTIENNGKIFIVKNSKINHLGAKAVDDKYNDEIELSRNWHWMWSKFYFNKKHRGIFVSTLLGLNSLLTNLLKYFMYTLIFNKKKNIYRMRMSGIFNALIGRKSWFRPELN